MWSAFIYVKNLAGLAIFMFLLCFGHCFHVNPIPCNVSLSESCHALLYYVPKSPRTLEETTSLFHVNSNSVNRTVNGYAIAIECSCPAGHSEFTWHADYTIQHGDTWESINEKFGSFVVKKNDRTLIESLTITLDLLCGCSKGVEVLSYRVESGDTLFTICSRFNTSVEKTKELNKLDNPRLIHAGDVIFIPKPELKVKRRSKSCLLIVGIFVAAVTTAILLAIIVLWRYYYRRKGPRSSQGSTGGLKYFNLSYSLRKSEETIIPSNYDKTTVFSYNEVCHATLNFRTSLKIGQGSCGSVYLGNLRGNDVAIKQMKNTKSKEFLSEINILCRVQHTNSIKLIGYTGGGDSLFLVYEFAKNGALSSHLHNPTERGYKPLTWIMQVQIALDAAKGLEYIHLNTKPSFIHRDVKSSNILLDSGFHAKIADFGLVKLSEHSPDNGTTASRIVGTFGYLAPEYARDGCVTTKIDVYAFGVVLMELLTGLPALRRDASTGSMQYVERCSLMDYVLSVLENGDAFTKLSQSIDPTLTQYHRGSLLQMALLSKDCVNADWNQRPDMSNVVLRLEHALVCSKEWEKAEPSSSEW
ncbi:lysM domain receptor-like kinase 3 isoform X2 [Diospyros lotus]|uniref:lysM domain receptor-like kinase 3 isoform X2 n=1 Tax=Diospyros lotus TaxID=55363 RepID=UPI00224F6E61|nr:lysM domain receptor-like kinase 3 isoform X2 [Diospyros lotus]